MTHFLYRFSTAIILAASCKAGALQLLVTPPDKSTKLGYLTANGVIEKGDSQRIRLLLEKFNANGNAMAILLTSPGGLLDETWLISQAVISQSKKLFRKFGVRNIVAVNEECSSACNILMAQLTNGPRGEALDILVTDMSNWGFHSPVHRIETKDKRDILTAEIADREERKKKISEEINSYRLAGVSGAWLEREANRFQESVPSFLTGKELCESDSQILPIDACVADGDITELVIKRLKKDP